MIGVAAAWRTQCERFVGKFVDDLHAMTILLRLGPNAKIETLVSLRTSFTDHLVDTLRGYNETTPSDSLLPVRRAGSAW